ncbi:MAG: hypothetical protein JWO63_98 [Frankiales bacterium]|jgi:uncharacterized OB-fold protein|nr:hypothetical protein [Frankiales bacterium]
MSERMPGFGAPHLTALNEGYWKAAGQGRLVIQRCDDCGTHRHVPVEICYQCHSRNWHWDEVPGTGRVFSYTWVDRPLSPELAQAGVYNISVVELDGVVGTIRLLTNVFGVDKDTLECDLPVKVAFDRVDDEIALPVFEPAFALNEAERVSAGKVSA